MTQNWQNRITRQGTVSPQELKANPHNWRIHPDYQRRVLKAILGEVGWVRGVLVNERTGLMLDGHLRVEEALANGEQSIPVTYVDLTVEEERKVLATFDPIGELAIQDQQLFAELTADLKFASADVGRLLAEMKHIPQVEIDYEEDKEITERDATLKIGDYQETIPRAVFLAWREQMYADVGMDNKDINAEMKRRLGFE